MHEEIAISGFGGQGVMFMGKFIAYIAMKGGYHLTYMPSYGAEVRGGTANCTVIISKAAIASPLSSNPSTLLVMNKPSLEKFSPKLKKDGLLILNSSLIDREPGRDDIKVIKLPANKLAEEAGNIRSANMVMLGACLCVKKLTSVQNACKLLPEVLPKRWHDMLYVNKKSLLAGEHFVLKNYQKEFPTS